VKANQERLNELVDIAEEVVDLNSKVHLLPFDLYPNGT
jgi:hypothetical protein